MGVCVQWGCQQNMKSQRKGCRPLLLKYFYDEKLAQASYLIGCQATGEAIVVDPARDITPYVEAAKREGVKIVAATETHIHADFVSGARELAKTQGAKLYLSGEGDAKWRQRYVDDLSAQWIFDKDKFRVGNIAFEVLHTPGHTPESVSFLVSDCGGNVERDAMGLLSGDFVFVGDIGRPDLLEKAVGVSGSSDQAARQMYQSIARFKSLPDHLQLWPGHGAGSACGKALGAIPSSTVGYEKRFNWAMADMDEATFVRELLAGQPEPPRYFAQMKKINVEGPALLGSLPEVPVLLQEDIRSLIAQHAQIVDTRSAAAFRDAHLPGTLNIAYNKSFITWAGWLLDYDRPLYVIADEGTVQGILRDLRAIGLDRVEGVAPLQVVAKETVGELESYEEISPREAKALIEAGQARLVDVRNNAEWEEGFIEGAQHVMLGKLMDHLESIPRDKPVVVQCQSGARSSIAASILQKHGIAKVINLAGGYSRWSQEGLPVKKEEREVASV